MKTSQLKGFILLLFTGIIWGSAFVAQSIGLEKIEAFTFNGIRTLMGSLVLLPVILILRKKQKKTPTGTHCIEKKSTKKKTLLYSFILSVIFCIATNVQQFAFYYTNSGKIAFITALYIFFVPFVSIFLKKKISLFTWLSVAFGFLGLYFLCINPHSINAINLGDILAIICSIFFTIHILLVEKFTTEVDGLHLSFIQFLFSGIFTCILMFIFENPKIDEIKSAIIPLLYAGVFSTGIAYTFQILGQKYISATIASLLMSTESVFAVLTAAIILNETMTSRETIGSIIMFTAIIFAQLSEQITAKIKRKFFKQKTS